MSDEFSSGYWKLKKFLWEKDFIKELNRLMNIKRVSVMQYGPYGGGPSGDAQNLSLMNRISLALSLIWSAFSVWLGYLWLDEKISFWSF
ncbi:MAG: hypothetical protein KAT53_03505, partial [Dehalococcoidia bacterium]|nr:hypothetical protein [Dehalococcoidia bacterium]